MIKGLGIDLVKIDRIEEICNRWGEKFLHRVFTTGELSYCQQKSMIYQHLSGRFAAKEATLKMLGIGLRGLNWQEIEVEKDKMGRPEIVLYGKAKKCAESSGIKNIHLSISHEKEYAFAEVIGEG